MGRSSVVDKGLILREGFFRDSSLSFSFGQGSDVTVFNALNAKYFLGAKRRFGSGPDLFVGEIGGVLTTDRNELFLSYYQVSWPGGKKVYGDTREIPLRVSTRMPGENGRNLWHKFLCDSDDGDGFLRPLFFLRLPDRYSLKEQH